MVDELLTYVSVQVNIPDSAIRRYLEQPRTIITHQQEICDYLELRCFGEDAVAFLEAFLLEEACRLEQTGPLLVQAKAFLRENDIFFPADSTLRRLIGAQQTEREAEQICTVVATIMAYGCNIGPYTMSRLADDITYRQIKRVTDWQLTEEAQRHQSIGCNPGVGRGENLQQWRTALPDEARATPADL